MKVSFTRQRKATTFRWCVVYIVIAVVFIVLTGIIIYLESTELSADDMDATVDARVAAILTDANFESTNQARVDSVNATSVAQIDSVNATGEARETQIASDFPSTAEAQRELVLTDVAEAYPSDTVTPTPTTTSTITPAPTLTPTFTPTATPTIDPLRAGTIREYLDTTDLLLTTLEGNFNEFAWSPDQQLFATEYYELPVHEIRIYNRYDFSDYQVVAEVDDFVRRIAWSPDGTMLAVSVQTNVVLIFDTNTGEQIQSFSVESETEDLIWTPDSTYLLGGSSTAIVSWQVIKGEVADTVDIEQGWESLMSWSPDFSRFVASDGDLFRLFEIDATGDIDETFDSRMPVSGDISAVDWSPVEEEALVLMADGIAGTIYIVDVDRNVITGLLEGHNAFTVNVRWSPNGQFVASGSRDNSVRVWQVGDNLLTYDLNHGSRILSLAWADDGTLVTNSLTGIYFWSLNVDTGLNTDE